MFSRVARCFGSGLLGNGFFFSQNTLAGWQLAVFPLANQRARHSTKVKRKMRAEQLADTLSVGWVGLQIYDICWAMSRKTHTEMRLGKSKPSTSETGREHSKLRKVMMWSRG